MIWFIPIQTSPTVEICITWPREPSRRHLSSALMPATPGPNCTLGGPPGTSSIWTNSLNLRPTWDSQSSLILNTRISSAPRSKWLGTSTLIQRRSHHQSRTQWMWLRGPPLWHLSPRGSSRHWSAEDAGAEPPQRNPAQFHRLLKWNRNSKTKRGRRLRCQ